MDMTLGMLDQIRQVGRWRDDAAWTRVRYQLRYADWLANQKDAKPAWKKCVAKAMDAVAASDPSKPAEAVAAVEDILQPLAGAAKAYTLYCAGHAHIDMNWMWSWPETVGLTLDTFRTMLALLEEFPEFHFAQSQSSVYAIVEKYEPEMLVKIKKYVKEGRWEVTASHWVENDPNLAGAEPLAQHLLQTRAYMQQLFGLAPEDVAINFAPDSFGFAATTPSYLSQGGVRHVFMHRPGTLLQPVPELFWWEGPDGGRVLVHNAQRIGYNCQVTPDGVLNHLLQAPRHGVDCGLMVFGVGDHGGGPTRRDLLFAREMNTWPVFPNITMSSQRAYYERVEKTAKRLPVINSELNFEFAGCYTTQTLIKRDNRIGEARMQDAQTLDAAGRMLGLPPAAPKPVFDFNWREVLFSHFHDILPGSGVRDTRLRCHGQFQDIAAFTTSAMTKSLRAIAGRVDTLPFKPAQCPLPDAPTQFMSERGFGGGAGINAVDGAYSLAHGHGLSPVRPFVVFNPTAFERTEFVQFTLWDREFWDTHGQFTNLVFEPVDAGGNLLPAQRVATGNGWGHANQTYGVELTVPPLGYTTLAFRQQLGKGGPGPKCPVKVADAQSHTFRDSRGAFGIENEFLRLRVDPATGRAVSLVDKATGAELLDPAAGIGFEYSVERSEGMEAWVIERAGVVTPPKLTSLKRRQNGPFTGSLDLEFQVERSSIKLTYRLDACSRMLHMDFSATWLEPGFPWAGSPNLRLAIGTALKDPSLANEIPFGVIQRPGLPDDKEIPALRWVCLHAPEQPGLLLLNDCKHGHALSGSTLRVNLIRSSYGPDPLPELGAHKAAFAIEALPATVKPGKVAVKKPDPLFAEIRAELAPHSRVGDTTFTLEQYAAAAAALDASGLDLAALVKKGQAYNHPLLVFGTAVHAGDLPVESALLTLAGEGVTLSCVKPAEDGNGIILRLCNALDKPAAFTLAFDKKVGKPKSLAAVDFLERPAKGDAKKIPAKGILTLRAVW
ncbi:MAG: hypothetical protein FWF96_04100 [Kiritimatiellaeota bacterium]|nr:hypothetical protein [Kiritimatiellota bacterium]